jgi:hypothetical protein
MRIVSTPEELAPALASARREAASGFGDERVFLERFARPGRGPAARPRRAPHAWCARWQFVARRRAMPCHGRQRVKPDPGASARNCALFRELVVDRVPVACRLRCRSAFRGEG